jgi:hypothetical protein
MPYSKGMRNPLPTKSNEEIALLLITRPARTEQGRKVQAAVLARVEIAMAINAALQE